MTQSFPNPLWESVPDPWSMIKGLSPKDKVVRTYDAVLERSPDKPGKDYWLNKLAGGMSDESFWKSVDLGKEGKEFDTNKDIAFRDWNPAWGDPNENLDTILSDARIATPLGGTGYVAPGSDKFPEITIDSETTPSQFSDDNMASLRNLFKQNRGPSLDDFRSVLLELFDSPWTPVGYGWGGTNADSVRINRSKASRRGSAYAGNKSSFNRAGSRLNSQGTPWMNTLGI